MLRQLRAALMRLRGLLRPRQFEREMADEVESHLELHIDDNMRAGMAPDEARRHAILALGGIEQTKERYRDRRGVPALEHLVRDIKYGCRTFVKSPGFTLLAVITFALGIGVNVAIFSLVNSALFKPFAGERPEELVEVFAGDADARRGFSSHSYIDYLDFRDGSVDVLSGLAAFYTEPGSLAVGSTTERINVGLVSDNYFSVFGVQPLVGRGFLAEDNATPGAHYVAVISESLWRRQLGAPSDLSGTAVSLNSSSYTVVGVVPETAAQMFGFVKIDVFVPAMMQGPIRGGRDWLSFRGNHEFLAVGRLRRGVTLAQAQAAFTAIGDRLQQAYPDAWRTDDGRGRGLTVVPATRLAFEMRGHAVGFAALLMGAVGSVLLITCSNLADFLLARTIARRKEIAVRLALGASRWRLVHQLLTENLVLAVVGGAVGFLVAVWTKDLLTAFTPSLGVPLAVDLSVDQRVLGFCVVAILVATLASGLPAALQGTTAGSDEALRETSLSHTTGRRHTRLRDWLIVGQVAVSLVLVMCGGMFIRSLGKLRSIDVGFDSSNLALLSVNLSTQGYSEPGARAFFQEAAARLERMPNVEAVSLAARVPMALSRVHHELRAPDGISGAVDQGIAYVAFNRVDHRYFETMRIPIVRGRGFDRRDHGGSPAVVVNDAFAGWFWPGEDPIGKAIQESSGATREVVGVVKTSKYESVNERATPFLYLPIVPALRSDVTLHVRTRSDPAAMLEPLRRELLALDSTTTVFDVQTMNDHLADSLVAVRMGALLSGIFGALALGLASIGLYGVMAYAVSQRTKELGIRLALGARPQQACRLVLRQGLSLTMRGVLIGVAVGTGLSTVIATELYGVTSTDVATLAAVVAIQSGVALVACWVPARRAFRIDPMSSLRCE